MTHIFWGAAVQPKGVCQHFNYPKTPTQSSRKSVMCCLQLREIITLPLNICNVHGTGFLLVLRGTELTRVPASQRLPLDLLADTRGRALAVA
jgi:hypothetical protein